MNRLRRWLGHPFDHTRCSFWTDCPVAVEEHYRRKYEAMEQSYQSLKRTLESSETTPAFRNALLNAEVSSIARSGNFAHLTYDPFTFQSRRF